METTRTIKESRYLELVEAEKKLNALIAAGVDNWDGYNQALGDGEESEEDIYGED